MSGGESVIKVLGVAITLLGAAALLDAFGLFDFDTPFVRWMDRHGRNAGWVIRGGTLALGLSLVFLPPRGDR